MNKTKLEVIRINEDVITTSMCEHKIDHIHIFAVDSSSVSYYFHKYENNKLNSGSQFFDQDILGLNESNSNIDDWYHWNGSNYVKCEDQSDNAHPIKEN